MRLVVDANVLLSAIIADSKTRELLVTIDPSLLAPDVVEAEIVNYEALIVEKSGMDPERVTKFLELLFQYVEVVPTSEFVREIERADDELGDTDPDDVLNLACALAYDAAIWSDDTDFESQSLVDVYTTADLVRGARHGLLAHFTTSGRTYSPSNGDSWSIPTRSQTTCGIPMSPRFRNPDVAEIEWTRQISESGLRQRERQRPIGFDGHAGRAGGGLHGR